MATTVKKALKDLPSNGQEPFGGNKTKTTNQTPTNKQIKKKHKTKKGGSEGNTKETNNFPDYILSKAALACGLQKQRCTYSRVIRGLLAEELHAHRNSAPHPGRVAAPEMEQGRASICRSLETESKDALELDVATVQERQLQRWLWALPMTCPAHRAFPLSSDLSCNNQSNEVCRDLGRWKVLWPPWVEIQPPPSLPQTPHTHSERGSSTSGCCQPGPSFWGSQNCSQNNIHIYSKVQSHRQVTSQNTETHYYFKLSNILTSIYFLCY